MSKIQIRADFRSDTVTLPTEEMRRAMFEAQVGDDVYGEDPSINKLEQIGAELLGKEAGLFVTSGTQGNLISILTHTLPGQEILLESESHVFYYEVASAARIGGIQTRTIPGCKGMLDPAAVEAAIRPDDIHFPTTGLILLENTHNRAGGTAIPLTNMESLAAMGKHYCIPLHLDGARIFNAAVALDVEAKQIAVYADSVMFCLSKGLCAPVGSLIVGTEEFIVRARKWRKLLGGGMRQAGVLAAAGIVALEQMIRRLPEDHGLARYLAAGLSKIPGLAVLSPDTNIVLVDLQDEIWTARRFLDRMAEKGVRATGFGPNTVRFVTHKDVDRTAADYVLKVVTNILEGDR
ncbi:MAG TPA: low-specificity L-threonine aldolase [bacterium]|nr:low-specificity L-threonine aldolase [bacterium]